MNLQGNLKSKLIIGKASFGEATTDIEDLLNKWLSVHNVDIKKIEITSSCPEQSDPTYCIMILYYMK